MANYREATLNTTVPVKLPKPKPSESYKELKRLSKLPSPWLDAFPVMSAIDDFKKVRLVKPERIAERNGLLPHTRDSVMQTLEEMAEFWPRFVKKVKEADKKVAK